MRAVLTGPHDDRADRLSAAHLDPGRRVIACGLVPQTSLSARARLSLEAIAGRRPHRGQRFAAIAELSDRRDGADRQSSSARWPTELMVRVMAMGIVGATVDRATFTVMGTIAGGHATTVITTIIKE